jgi:hypothetical protein
VSIVDENVESVPLDPQADIVGVCGMGVQFARQSELLAYYPLRDRGRHRIRAGDPKPARSRVCPIGAATGISNSPRFPEARFPAQHASRIHRLQHHRQLHAERSAVAVAGSIPDGCPPVER